MKFNKFIKLFLFLIFVVFTNKPVVGEENLIVVEKKNVIHKFVPVDRETDHFTRNVFRHWENETFDVFDLVKDSNGIAIDLGGWIGTTAIWLSNNFHHVLTVEADNKSLDCLQKNLTASNCSNVTICERPVSNISYPVIFGPRRDELNRSISFIKDVSDNTNDYITQSITFKQLIHDYIYENPRFNERNITFIKCDIEGGEESILEDILHFAYYNKVKVYMSFHESWWKTKNIFDFEYLFKFFKTNCPEENLCQYIKHNPFASILFEPLENAGPLIKNNMTAVIIGYNQFTFIKNMVSQLEKYTSDIVLIDNNSQFQPLLDYYKNEYKYTLLKQKANFGHTVYKKESIQKMTGDVYILTDPDLRINPNLPDDFIKTLVEISNYFGTERVGFALFIDSDDIRTDIKLSPTKPAIKDWEAPHWKSRVEYPKNSSLELYWAALDTTFCLVDRRRQGNNVSHIRVAGDFTCIHIPWHKNYQDELIEGEYEAYLQDNVSTTWYKME